MKRFVEEADRGQSALFPLDDWIDEYNPVGVIDVFVDELALGELGFGGIDPEGDREALISSNGPLEALHLRLSQPGPVEAPARALHINQVISKRTFTRRI